MEGIDKNLTKEKRISLKSVIDEIFQHRNTKEFLSKNSTEVVYEKIYEVVEKHLEWAKPYTYMAYIPDKIKQLRDTHAEQAEIVEHVGELDVNIEEASVEQYLSFGDKIKKKVATPLKTNQPLIYVPPSLYVLQSHNDEEVKRQRYFPVKVSTSSNHVNYIITRDSLYILGWMTSTENYINLFKRARTDQEYLSMDKDLKNMKDMIRKMPFLENLEPQFRHCEFEESYGSMQAVSGKDRSNIQLGKTQLLSAVHTLCKRKTIRDVPEDAKAMTVSVEMISEFARLRTVRNFLKVHYDKGEKPDSHMLDLETSWGHMSENVLSWSNTGVSVDLQVGSTIYRSAEMAHELLIAKNEH